MIALGLFMPKTKPNESLASKTPDGCDSLIWIVFSSTTVISWIAKSLPNSVRLAQRDLVHLTGPGYQKLGDLLLQALDEARKTVAP